jgi:hypothetical protein
MKAWRFASHAARQAVQRSRALGVDVIGQAAVMKQPYERTGSKGRTTLAPSSESATAAPPVIEANDPFGGVCTETNTRMRNLYRVAMELW